MNSIGGCNREAHQKLTGGGGTYVEKDGEETRSKMNKEILFDLDPFFLQWRKQSSLGYRELWGQSKRWIQKLMISYLVHEVAFPVIERQRNVELRMSCAFHSVTPSVVLPIQRSLHVRPDCVPSSRTFLFWSSSLMFLKRTSARIDQWGRTGRQGIAILRLLSSFYYRRS